MRSYEIVIERAGVLVKEVIAGGNLRQALRRAGIDWSKVVTCHEIGA